MALSTASHAARPPAGERVFFLDSARALFMLLGIPFHAALIFGTLGPWLIHDSLSSEALTIFSALLHIFRMPGFFLIAGFFAAMLIARRGPVTWLSDRAVRLGVPLITSILLLNPVQLWVEAATRVPESETMAAMGTVLARNPDRLLSHLWFLPALLLHCLALALMWRFGRPLGAPARAILAWAAGRAYALPLLALSLIVWEMAQVPLDTAARGMLPGYASPMLDALIYLPWFLIGVAVQCEPRLLTKMTRIGPFALLATLIFVPLNMITFLLPDLPHAYFWEVISDPVAGLGLVICILAFLRRHADSHNPLVAQVVAASFTIYLFHQPVILLTEYALMGLGLPPVAKWAIIVAITLPTCFAVHRLIASQRSLLFLFNGVRSRRERTMMRPAAS